MLASYTDWNSVKKKNKKKKVEQGGKWGLAEIIAVDIIRLLSTLIVTPSQSSAITAHLAALQIQAAAGGAILNVLSYAIRLCHH